MPKGPGRHVFRLLGEAISDFEMIKDEDILLGISGGKDSLLMAWLLADIRKRAPVKFGLKAITIDPGSPSAFSPEDISTIRDYLESLGISYTVIDTNIARIVQEYPTKKTACSLCANLRRGALYKEASTAGIRKVALGHHLDDAIETLFLNMFFQGKFRCFQPRTFLTRTRVEVIRPLVYIEESTIQKACKTLGIPVVATRCPIAGTTERQHMKQLVRDLSSQIPGFHNQLRRVLKSLWTADSPSDQKPLQ